jgi:FKBP-type peptidyl-prolyl cis-trans isomerase (trigger factor)
MENEIKKFDVNEAMKNVKDKIKDALVTLIPDEQWNEMVKKEVDSYFHQKQEGYGERGYSSSFTKDVHSILEQEVKDRVKTYLNENFNAIWYDNGVPVCNAKVEEMITKNAGKILSDMIGGTIQMALQNAGYRL